jgi:hypothetical protein
MLRLTPSILLAAIAACSISDARAPSEVTVDVASVTLADNCNPVSEPSQQKFAKPPGGSQSRSECDGPGCGMSRRKACEQTSMQLAIRAHAGTTPTTITIKRVELLDNKGRVLDVLTPSAPVRWTPKGVYVQWDQTISASDDLINASYALTAPDWTKLGGRLSAQSRTFQLRVTVAVGTSQRTVVKQAIVPGLTIEPPVVT